MMSKIEVWDHIADERSAVADLAETLTEEQLDEPSLCEGWRVRDVIGHLTWVALTRPPEVAQQMLLGGLKVGAVTSQRAIESGSVPTDRLVAQMRAGAESRIAAPGFPPIGYLADVVVHHCDIRRPLGLPRKIPPERLVAVLRHVVGGNRFTGSKRRVKGVRLLATDVDFDHGSGPEARGPGEAIAMVATGRAAAIDDLSGEGAEVLAGRF